MSELEDFIDEIDALKKSNIESPEFITWKKDLSVLVGLISETGLINIKKYWEIKFYPKSKDIENNNSFVDGLEKIEQFLKELFDKMKLDNPEYQKIDKKIEVEDNILDIFIKNWKFSIIIVFIFYAFTAYFIPFLYDYIK